ncbi:TonB-dependent receptor [Indibacter alkaliphilus LW1]|uniref:TonB-dependent receptor n=1 Tax=Indibacter alkaliphilus (strain CCUG 57479 / KCTC 22604 / LW1) TaxID=1189612 RepID=S2DTB5_INDAL|nr:TonB-dependent receptor [Indibacter alkaliphilus]EOZ95331.1 TonB-dependent receptor [Indibacter alkaliphilus LW1]
MNPDLQGEKSIPGINHFVVNHSVRWFGFAVLLWAAIGASDVFALPGILNEKSNSLQAEINVSGVVTDEAGEPLPGATVSVEGTSLGTITDIDGQYTIEVPDDAVLVVSFIGFESRRIPVNGRSIIDVGLTPDTSSLEEVVVVGYGTQKRANLTGSVAEIETEDLVSRPFSSTVNALQGVSPGVTVTTGSGAPGSQGTIRVRGIGTLNNSNPLVIIDGVEGDMNSIDPSLIESINVLKDAASSAIYGSRAANGVILVTTKRAKSGEFRVTYNAYTGFQSPTNLPNKVGAIDHMEMINLAHINSGASPLFADSYIQEYSQNMQSDPDNYPNTDWQRGILTGSGFMQNHNISLNAGTEKVRSLTSVGYLEQKGLIEMSGFKRYTIRNNLDVKFNEKLSLAADLQMINRKTVSPGGGLSEVFLQMNRIPAIQPGRFSNGLYGEGWNGNNPMAFSTALGGSQEETRMSLLGRFVLNYKPVKWLNVELLAQPRYEELYNDNFNKAITTYQPDGSPLFTRPERSTLAMRSVRNTFDNYYGYITSQHVLNEHEFKLLAGASLETFHTTNFRAFRDEFLFPEYRVLNAGAQDRREASGSAAEWALQSFFGRFNYDYASKYLIEVNARYDGSSRFAPGRRYGFFPSVSGGWRVSGERFMESVSGTINNLMVRASWGRLGNQNIGNYPFASTLALGSYSMGNEIVPIAALNEMNNENISWETTEMTNIGLDLMLFRNLTVSFDIFDKTTSDILLNLDIPMSIGLAPPTQNAGTVRNRGWELAVGYNGQAGEFKYGVNFNLSDVRNEVIDLRGVSQSGLLVSREGFPINSIFALQADGYFQNQEEIDNHAAQFGTLGPGDIRYVNQNPEVDDLINADDYVIIGSTIPRYTYGLNVNSSFRNFSMNLFIQGVGKADGYLHGRAIQPFYSGASAFEVHKDYWTPENPNATFPRLTWGDAGNNYQHSSFWMRDASYLRLKNIQFGYNLPRQFTERMKIGSARFYVNGQNLLTIDNFWPGYDVETPVGTGTNYPIVKIYTLGVDVVF